MTTLPRVTVLLSPWAQPRPAGPILHGDVAPAHPPSKNVRGGCKRVTPLPSCGTLARRRAARTKMNTDFSLTRPLHGVCYWIAERGRCPERGFSEAVSYINHYCIGLPRSQPRLSNPPSCPPTDWRLSFRNVGAHSYPLKNRKRVSTARLAHAHCAIRGVLACASLPSVAAFGAALAARPAASRLQSALIPTVRDAGWRSPSGPIERVG